jgi:hypothetical protein
MRWFATVFLGLMMTALATPHPAPAQAASLHARDDDWRGDPEAMPDRYAWLNDFTPSDTYDIVVVRGLRRWQVVAALGGVKRRLPAMTPGAAEGWYFDHLGPLYDGPRVVQVQRRGPAMVVYVPYGFVTEKALARLSRHRVAASFSTTVELDTYVTVAKRGRVVRQFDAGFEPPAPGALPQEDGLDWGAPDQNVWATGWAFNERVTLTHVSREWFSDQHPTFVVKGTRVY